MKRSDGNKKKKQKITSEIKKNRKYVFINCHHYLLGIRFIRIIIMSVIVFQICQFHYVEDLT